MKAAPNIVPRTEAELCDLFAEAARADGWDVYPEVRGWDLLLVWRGAGRSMPAKSSRFHEDLYAAVPAGWQFGIDAKMRANVEVLDQAASRMGAKRRPDAGAVLVPTHSGSFESLARRLGLAVFDLRNCADRKDRYGWERERRPISPISIRAIPPETRTGPVPLPPVPLVGSGGHASPRSLTPWRVAALRLCILLEQQGHLTGADFKAHGVDRRTWLEQRWLVAEGSGRPARYLPGPRLQESGPAVGYEAEQAAIAARDAEAPSQPETPTTPASPGPLFDTPEVRA